MYKVASGALSVPANWELKKRDDRLNVNWKRSQIAADQYLCISNQGRSVENQSG